MTGPHDVLVVGNGAVGLWAATELARGPGARVAVVGPNGRPGGASAASGAMLGCYGEVTRHTFASAPGRERFDLQRNAHARWPAELAELAAYVDGPIPVASDTYVVLNSRGGVLDSANLQAMAQALHEHDVPHAEVTEVPDLQPTPTGRPLRALHLPDEGAVHSGRLLTALAARAVALGVELIDAEVTAVNVVAGRAVGVELAGGVALDADQVVVAAGAWTTPLVRGIGGPPVQPVFAGSGVAYVAERVLAGGLRSAIRTVTRAGSCGLHAMPLGGRQEYFGATNVVFAAPEDRPHLGVCLFLAECAIDQIDRRVSFSRIDEIRVGNRPVAMDTFPLLGPGPVDGVWILSGGYRDGLHAAPEVAALLAASIDTGRSCFPEVFAPTRAPISTMSVDESVEEFVEQQLGGAFEGGLHLTPFLGTDELAAAFRRMGHEVHERVGATEGLAPDLVTFLGVTRKDPDNAQVVAAHLATVHG
jgi:glycine oxidase